MSRASSVHRGYSQVSAGAVSARSGLDIGSKFFVTKAPGAASFMANSPPHLLKTRLSWGLGSSLRYLRRKPVALARTQNKLYLTWACVSAAHPDWPGKASLGLVSKQNLSCLVSLKCTKELVLDEDSEPSPRSPKARFAGGIWHLVGSFHLAIKGSDFRL